MSEESKNSKKKLIVNAPPSSTKLFDGKCSERSKPLFLRLDYPL